jgi:hypothetical protein
MNGPWMYAHDGMGHFGSLANLTLDYNSRKRRSSLIGCSSMTTRCNNTGLQYSSYTVSPLEFILLILSIELNLIGEWQWIV